MAARKARSLEKPIENDILKWLEAKGAMIWKNQSVGIWDTKKRLFRRSNNRFHRKGVPDILGIYKGVPLAVEVKSAKGVVSPDQHQFIDDFIEAGGIAFIARSIDDVERELERWTTQ